MIHSSQIVSELLDLAAKYAVMSEQMDEELFLKIAADRFFEQAEEREASFKHLSGLASADLPESDPKYGAMLLARAALAEMYAESLEPGDLDDETEAEAK